MLKSGNICTAFVTDQLTSEETSKLKVREFVTKYRAGAKHNMSRQHNLRLAETVAGPKVFQYFPMIKAKCKQNIQISSTRRICADGHRRVRRAASATWSCATLIPSAATTCWGRARGQRASAFLCTRSRAAAARAA